ncbi:MAG TPA: GvpL/GvpF family gas vesicle protein, partial [Chloroflexota bacterium]
MSFIYLYCLLPAAGDVSVEAIEGMEPGSAVRLIDAGQLRAAVSEVGDDFAEAQLNARVRDLDWLSPRAVRHHDVVDQLYARCKLMLPLAFGSIFSSLESLRQRLQEQEQELLGRLAMLRQREQWDLKLTRDRPTFGAELARHSPPLADLEAELAAKPPGTRFLLEKKRQTVHAREAQRLSAAVRADVHQAL